jgi:hypothetical protein
MLSEREVFPGGGYEISEYHRLWVHQLFIVHPPRTFSLSIFISAERQNSKWNIRGQAVLQ